MGTWVRSGVKETLTTSFVASSGTVAKISIVAVSLLSRHVGARGVATDWSSRVRSGGLAVVAGRVSVESHFRVNWRSSSLGLSTATTFWHDDSNVNVSSVIVVVSFELEFNVIVNLELNIVEVVLVFTDAV